MTPGAPYALLVLGLSVLLWPPVGADHGSGRIVRRRGRRRSAGSEPGRSPADPRRRLVLLGPVLVVLMIAPEAWWLLLGAAVLVAVRGRAATRAGGPRSRRQADLAVHHELIAACLDAGMPVGTALRAVAEALPGAAPVGRPGSAAAPGGATDPPGDDPGRVLGSVAAMLELGAGPDAAWKPADDDPDLRPLAAAARRSALGGAGLADAVREQARALRAQVETAERQATGRAGVLMVAPLGLCFLPAFLCLGLAPVVLGLIDRLDLF